MNFTQPLKTHFYYYASSIDNINCQHPSCSVDATVRVSAAVQIQYLYHDCHKNVLKTLIP